MYLAYDQVRNPPGSSTQGHITATSAPMERCVRSAQEGPYEVRLARRDELEEVFALRHEVFLSGHTGGSFAATDQDQYDEFADHLIVSTGSRVVATYRLMPVDRILRAGLMPYSAQEFHLNQLLESMNPSAALELGRSCVHPEHRNGAIPKLLWNALAKYMIHNGRTDAFGCVSVFNTCHGDALALVTYFQAQGVWAEGIHCRPVVPVDAEASQRSGAELKALVPPLLRSYLTLGSRLYGGPSYDPVFRSHDFLIHFSTRTMSERCRKSLFSGV
jgi:putative hemolysin